MTRRFIGPAALFAGFVFLHLPVEDLFDWLARRFGFEAYDRGAFAAFAFGGAVLFVAAWLLPTGRRLLIGGSVTGLLVLTAIVQRLLVVVSIENIHYPQYALLLWALARALPNIEYAWLLALGLGTIDEGYQFVVQTRGTPEYFDWNDVVLNAIGASMGVVAMIALGSGTTKRKLLSWRAAASIAVVLLVAALLVDPPVFSPFFRYSPGGRAFHKLSATEAVAVVVGLWAAVRAWLSAPNRPNR